MRSRIAVLILALAVFAFFSGCTPKQQDQAQSTMSNAADAAKEGADKAAGAAKETVKKAGEAMKEAAAPAPTVVPAGTTITIRLGQTLSSKTSQAGEAFQGTVTTPVTVDGKEAIPAGAAVTGTVTDAKPLGKFKGGASLAVRLNTIEVGGKSYTIDTTSVAREMKGKGKRTAVLAGGGAAVGAIIGGLAGGGKGAAIGALAGGGAGTAGAAFTGNKDIIFPAETALSFKLKDALELK
jgi:hypothetical protein